MKLKWNRIVIFGLICIVYVACSPRGIAGHYSNSQKGSRNYSYLHLDKDGQFSYDSNVYVPLENAPHMPTMPSLGDSTGKGEYRIEGAYIILDYGEEEQLLSPSIERVDDQINSVGKYQIELKVIDVSYEEGNGPMPFSPVAILDSNNEFTGDGVMTDIDGLGYIKLYMEDFPCYLEFSFTGYDTQIVTLEKRGNYKVSVAMSMKSYEMHGERKYRIEKKKGKLMINGMKKSN